jgi:hypothetical protein
MYKYDSARSDFVPRLCVDISFQFNNSWGGLNFLSEDDGLKEMGRIKTLHWSIIFLLLTDLGDCLF